MKTKNLVITFLFICILVLSFLCYNNYILGYKKGVKEESLSNNEILTNFSNVVKEFSCPTTTVEFPTCPVCNCQKEIEKTKLSLSVDKGEFQYNVLYDLANNIKFNINEKDWSKCVSNAELFLEKNNPTLKFFSDYYQSMGFVSTDDENFVYNYLVEMFDNQGKMMESVLASCKSSTEPSGYFDEDYLRSYYYYNQLSSESSFPELQKLRLK